MDRYARSHFADQTLLLNAKTNAGRERTSMADLLADIAEIDARRLYVPAAYPSMFAFCVGELWLSEDAAAKRIQAARAARRFPAIFRALAAGRLHLSAVVLLAPYLREDSAGELLRAAVHKTKSEIERLLAARFPRPDVLAWAEGIATADQHAPGHVDEQLAARAVEDTAAPEPLPAQHAPGHVDMRPRVKPLSAQSFAVQFTLSRSEHDLLQHAQDLLPGDVREVFVRALKAHVRQLEKGKFAATDKPRRACPRPTRSARHIPDHVRRAVWERDGGQCTFVSETGYRCEARRGIQFDHIHEVARGGDATVSNTRLLCRTHNQHAAERTFGTEFMKGKRDDAKRLAAARHVKHQLAARRVGEVGSRSGSRALANMQSHARAAGAPSPAIANRHAGDLMACLRELGFRPGEVRLAVERCESDANAPLEEQVRSALRTLSPKAALRCSATPRPAP